VAFNGEFASDVDVLEVAANRHTGALKERLAVRKRGPGRLCASTLATAAARHLSRLSRTV
jgi:hypothetical protein